MANTFQVTQSNTKTIVVRRIIYPQMNDFRSFQDNSPTSSRKENETRKGKGKGVKNSKKQPTKKFSKNTSRPKTKIKQNAKRQLLPCDKYEKGKCSNGILCSYMHQEFPCLLFYLGNKCQKKDCKFLHNEPLPLNILEALIKYAKTLILKNLLPYTPKLTKTDVEAIINRTQIELLRKKFVGIEYETLVNAQNNRPLEETLSFLSQKQLKQLKEMGVKNHYEAIMLNTWQLNILGITDGVLYQKIVDACLNISRSEDTEKVLEEPKNQTTQYLSRDDVVNTNEVNLISNRKLNEISLDDYEALARLPKEAFFHKILERNYYLRNQPLPKEVRIREIEKFRTQLKALQTELLSMLPVKYNSPKMSKNTMVVVHDQSSCKSIENLEIELQRFAEQILDKEFIESLKPKSKLSSKSIEAVDTANIINSKINSLQHQKNRARKSPRNLLKDIQQFSQFSKDYENLQPIKIEKLDNHENKVNGELGEKFHFAVKKCRIMLKRLKEIEAVPIPKNPRVRRQLLSSKRCSKRIKKDQLMKDFDSPLKKLETAITAAPLELSLNKVQSENVEQIDKKLEDEINQEKNTLQNHEKSHVETSFDKEKDNERVKHPQQALLDAKEVAIITENNNNNKTENTKKKNEDEDESNAMSVEEEKEAEPITEKKDTLNTFYKYSLRVTNENKENDSTLPAEERNDLELVGEKSSERQNCALLIGDEKALEASKEQNKERENSELSTAKNEEKTDSVLTVEENEKIGNITLKTQVKKNQFLNLQEEKENERNNTVQDKRDLVKDENGIGLTEKTNQEKNETPKIVEKKNEVKPIEIKPHVKKDSFVRIKDRKGVIIKKKETTRGRKKNKSGKKSLLSSEKQKKVNSIEEKSQEKSELLLFVKNGNEIGLAEKLNEEKNEIKSLLTTIQEKSGAELNQQDTNNILKSVELIREKVQKTNKTILEKCNLKIVDETLEAESKHEGKEKQQNDNENTQSIERKDINEPKETVLTNSLESFDLKAIEKETNLKTKQTIQHDSKDKSSKSKNLKSEVVSDDKVLKTKNLLQENLDMTSKALSFVEGQTDHKLSSEKVKNENEKLVCSIPKESVQKLYKKYAKKAKINKELLIKLEADSKTQNNFLNISKVQPIKKDKENEIQKSLDHDRLINNILNLSKVNRLNRTIKTEGEMCFIKPQKQESSIEIDKLFERPYKIPKISASTCTQELVSSEIFKSNDIAQDSITSLLRNPFKITDDQDESWNKVNRFNRTIENEGEMCFNKPQKQESSIEIDKLFGRPYKIPKTSASTSTPDLASSEKIKISEISQVSISALLKNPFTISNDQDESWVEEKYRLNNLNQKNDWKSLQASTPVPLKRFDRFLKPQEPIQAKTSAYNLVLRQKQKTSITANETDFFEMAVSDISSIKSWDDSQAFSYNETKSRNLIHRYSSGFSSTSNTELTQEDLCDWDKEFMDTAFKFKNNKNSAVDESPRIRPYSNCQINSTSKQLSAYTPNISLQRNSDNRYKNFSPLPANHKDRCTNILPWVLYVLDLPNVEVNKPSRLDELISSIDYEDARLKKYYKPKLLTSSSKFFNANKNERNRLMLLNKIQSSDWCSDLPSDIKDKVVKLSLFNLTRALTIYNLNCKQTNSELEFSLHNIDDGEEIKCALDLLDLYVNNRGEVMPKDIIPTSHNIVVNPLKKEPTYAGYAGTTDMRIQPQQISSAAPAYKHIYYENQSNRRGHWSTRQRYANRTYPFFRKSYHQP